LKGAVSRRPLTVCRICVAAILIPQPVADDPAAMLAWSRATQIERYGSDVEQGAKLPSATTGKAMKEAAELFNLSPPRASTAGRITQKA
jgi:hypothetical protein